MYEYYDEVLRAIHAEEKVKENDDIIEDKKMQEALDWAEREELKELEEQKRLQEKGKLQEAADNAVAVSKPEEFEPDEEQQQWMQAQLDKQMLAMKELYGDEFGEDITDED